MIQASRYPGVALGLMVTSRSKNLMFDSQGQVLRAGVPKLGVTLHRGHAVGGVNKVSPRNVLRIYLFTVFILYSIQAVIGATSYDYS